MKARDIREKLAALKKLVEEIDPLLEDALSHRDPFALHVFASRREYAQAVQNATKSGKRIEYCLR